MIIRFKSLLINKWLLALATYFLFLIIWWFYINLTGLKDDQQNYLFGASYTLISIYGGVYGMKVSKRWGGIKSAVGRSLFFLAFGLFAFSLGQIIWTYFNIIQKVTVPYPSIADIGYILSIPAYLLGMVSLARVSGARFALKKRNAKILVVTTPFIMLLFSYLVFLKDYQFDLTQPIKIIIDFGYPLGQALTISMAILALILTRNYLGGIMKNRIRYIIFALVFQYATDFSFLFQAAHGTYVNGGVIDLMYASSFFIMTAGLISFEYPKSPTNK